MERSALHRKLKTLNIHTGNSKFSDEELEMLDKATADVGNWFMRKLAFLLLLCLISCGDAERKANGMLSDEENVKIKEYITKQFQAKKSVNLKRTFGTNLKGLKLGLDEFLLVSSMFLTFVFVHFFF